MTIGLVYWTRLAATHQPVGWFDISRHVIYHISTLTGYIKSLLQ